MGITVKSMKANKRVIIRMPVAKFIFFKISYCFVCPVEATCL